MKTTELRFNPYKAILNQARGQVQVAVVLMKGSMMLVWRGLLVLEAEMLPCWAILIVFLLVLLLIQITTGMQTPVLDKLQTKQPLGGVIRLGVGSAANLGPEQSHTMQTPVLGQLQIKQPWGGVSSPGVGSAAKVGPEQSWGGISSSWIITITKVRIQTPVMGCSVAVPKLGPLHGSISCVNSRCYRIWCRESCGCN